MKFLTIRNDLLDRELAAQGVQVLGFNFSAGLDPKKFYDFAAAHKPDVFWFLKDPRITRDVLIGLRRASPKTKNVMWWGDQRGYVMPPLIAARRELLHALFMTNDDSIERKIFENAGIKHVVTMYHSFSTTEFQLWPTPITHDVFFGGSNFKTHKFPMSPFRSRLIASIRNKFKLVVHGNGWKFPTERWILRPEYAKQLRKARMNLGVNHYEITRYYNRRLFESVASGRLHLTHYIPGMEKDFQNGKQLVWFTSADQCLGQIKYFLKNPAHREQIATEGREFFIKHHSWPIRAKQLIKNLNEIL